MTHDIIEGAANWRAEDMHRRTDWIHDFTAGELAELDAALAASPDKLYPMDIDRAFMKLDQIKPHIKVWWTQGNQSQQLIRDGEIDVMAIWNARASELGVLPR